MTILARTAVADSLDETIAAYARARSTTNGDLLSLDLLTIQNQRGTASAS